MELRFRTAAESEVVSDTINQICRDMAFGKIPFEVAHERVHAISQSYPPAIRDCVLLVDASGVVVDCYRISQS